MRTLPLAGFATAFALFLADQATKYGVTGMLGFDTPGDQRIVTGFFNITFVQNRGVSLGLLHADSDTTRWLLVLMTGAIAVGVLVWMLREKNRADQMALGLVMGGAMGNILDRARLGYVVDFADLHIGAWQPFLVFNLADAAISIGVLILFVRALLIRDKATPDSRTDSGQSSAAEERPTENFHA